MALVDVSQLEKNADGALKCSNCGAWSRTLFTVIAHSPRPICHRCVSKIIRGAR